MVHSGFRFSALVVVLHRVAHHCTAAWRTPLQVPAVADLDNRRFDADATIRRSLRMFHSAAATKAEATLPTSAKSAAVTDVTELKLLRSSASASQSHEGEQLEPAEETASVSAYVNSLNIAAIGSAAFGMIESLAQLTDSDSDGGLRLGRERDVFSPSSIAKTRQANPNPAGLADVPHRYPTGVWAKASHSPVAAPVGSRTAADFAAETEHRVPLLSAMQQLVLSVSRSASASATQSAEHSEVSTPSSAEITPRGTATNPMPKPPDLRAHNASIRCQWVAETQSLTELRLALQAHNPALHEDVASPAELSQKVL